MFDLIEIDLATAQEALERGELRAAVVAAARALLVTRGEEAGDDRQALELFRRHFVEAGLVVGEAAEVVGKAQRGSGDTQLPRRCVAELVTAVRTLYEGMDQSLKFHPVEEAHGSRGGDDRADREVDFRGVTCPLNYVKTRLLLDEMKAGEVLAVLLDDAGGKNVPESARRDGYDVLSAERTGDHWRVVIRKERKGVHRN